MGLYAEIFVGDLEPKQVLQPVLDDLGLTRYIGVVNVLRLRFFLLRFFLALPLEDAEELEAGAASLKRWEYSQSLPVSHRPR